MRVALDLHIHTLLSPCAGIEMIPISIVRRAIEVGIDMIAITDHNAVGNVEGVIRSALKYAPELVVLPGIEITSKEDVHILGILPSIDSACRLESIIHSHLISSSLKDYSSEQLVVDEDANFVRYEEHLLMGSTDLSIEEIASLIHSFDGIAIPAHIDREAFGLIYNLGIFPPDLDVDAVEISRFVKKDTIESIKRLIPPDIPIVFSSDAHFIDDIIPPKTFLELEDKSFNSLKEALNRYRHIRSHKGG